MRFHSTGWMVALLSMASPVFAADGAANVVQRYDLEEAQMPVSEREGWRKPKRLLVGGWIPSLATLVSSEFPGVEIVSATGQADAVRKAVDVDVVIGVCSPELIAAGASIRWIQLMSAGVERCVQIPAVRERNILVTNMQRIGGPIIAEHVMAMTLALTRGLDVYMTAQARREWRRSTAPRRSSVIDGKTMLVVGLGGIGSEVAQRAHALGMRVIATRASSRSGPDYVSYVGLPDELLKLASDADVIVNTAPLTPQTTGMFDAAFFAHMKPSAFFINVARGGSVDTEALVDALEQKRIAGAGLDVTDPEPLPRNHPLWSAPNVIITPHVANDSDLGLDGKIAVIQENLRRYIAGEPMLSVVDVERGY